MIIATPTKTCMEKNNFPEKKIISKEKKIKKKYLLENIWE